MQPSGATSRPRWDEAKALKKKRAAGLPAALCSHPRPASTEPIPDAFNRASDADKNVKAATQDVQKASIDLQQQVAAHG
jgi:hypothetical protein